jgi:hypothetical protein
MYFIHAYSSPFRIKRELVEFMYYKQTELEYDMPNFPGPYELEFEINMGAVVPARVHVIRANVAVVGSPSPGTLLSAITLQTAGGGTKTAQAAADQFWSFIRLNYAASVSVTEVRLWKYVSGTFAKDFISAGAVASPAGSSGATQTAQQDTLSFRSANGSVMKIVMLEAQLAGDTSVTLIPNAAGTPAQRIAAYILSADNVALARDDGFPVTALRRSLGQNERIWRKIYRAS